MSEKKIFEGQNHELFEKGNNGRRGKRTGMESREIRRFKYRKVGKEK